MHAVDIGKQTCHGLKNDISRAIFSLFRSVPELWKIIQLCFVIPVHRLTERLDQHAVLSEITCDSDGRLDRFIDLRSARDTLPLYGFDGSPHHLAVFPAGA